MRGTQLIKDKYFVSVMLKVDFGKDLMHTRIYIYIYISIIYKLVLGYMHNYVQVQVDL